jgi:hypothetical protein
MSNKHKLASEEIMTNTTTLGKRAEAQTYLLWESPEPWANRMLFMGRNSLGDLCKYKEVSKGMPHIVSSLYLKVDGRTRFNGD